MKLPPYVHQVRQKNGRLRWYFRRKGLPSVPLPDPRDKAAFAQVYARALRGGEPASSAKTLGNLITKYQLSPDWRALSEASRKTYGVVLRRVMEQPEFRDFPIDKFERHHIVNARDTIAQTKPASANLFVSVMQAVFMWGIDRGLRKMPNPADRISGIKGGEYRSWTDLELDQFRSHWPRGSLPRLIFELALHTGQRRGDIARMTWADVSNEGINVAQGKTGVKLWIPLHPSLSDELGRQVRRHAVVLAGPSGRPFTPSYLGAVFARAIDAAGLPGGCVFHGLRKAAARRLADAGGDDRDIMAITGHTTTEMVTHYTRDASQKARAKSAMGKVVRMDRER